MNNLDTEPWYKQGWPWALIAIPLLTVIAGVITFYIAYTSENSLVNDDYYKQGLAINTNLNKIELAKKLAIKVRINFDPATNLLSVYLKSNSTLPESLTIDFSHPTIERNDVQLTLARLTSNEYITELSALEQAHWHIKLTDKAKTWLVKSRWEFPVNRAIVIDPR